MCSQLAARMRCQTLSGRADAHAHPLRQRIVVGLDGRRQRRAIASAPPWAWMAARQRRLRLRQARPVYRGCRWRLQYGDDDDGGQGPGALRDGPLVLAAWQLGLGNTLARQATAARLRITSHMHVQRSRIACLDARPAPASAPAGGPGGLAWRRGDGETYHGTQPAILRRLASRDAHAVGLSARSSSALDAQRLLDAGGNDPSSSPRWRRAVLGVAPVDPAISGQVISLVRQSPAPRGPRRCLSLLSLFLLARLPRARSRSQLQTPNNPLVWPGLLVLPAPFSSRPSSTNAAVVLPPCERALLPPQSPLHLPPGRHPCCVLEPPSRVCVGTLSGCSCLAHTDHRPRRPLLRH